MNSPTERQQTRLMALMTNYKLASNKCNMQPKISYSFWVAMLSFIASILSLIFGCLCFSDCKVFNYAITALIIVLFIVILSFELRDYFGCKEKRLNKHLALAENGVSKKMYEKELFKCTLYRRTIRKELITTLSKKQEDNNRTVPYEVMTEEELLDEYVSIFGIEESITVYEKHLDALNRLIALHEKNEKKIRLTLCVFSFVALLVSVIYIVLNCIIK
ncbi:MAG: hypothetical protein J1F33_06885 [Clostridiales bacterium]|nr:hypothetical protein [Clostridiales bacterium]